MSSEKSLREESVILLAVALEHATMSTSINRFNYRGVLKTLLGFFILYLGLCGVVFFLQRWLMYFPSHEAAPRSRLVQWQVDGQTIGYCRQVDAPQTVWLMMHGNAGQAAYRDYVLQCLSDRDSLYVLEYPGYGGRRGNPSKIAFDQAASEAYRLLRQQYPDVPVCAIGESLGSGPASMLAKEAPPPDKIALINPFDSLQNIAASRFYFLPVGMLLLDRWDNVQALQGYEGELVIYAATADTIIPIRHPRRLAEQVAHAEFIEITGGHNDWATTAQVNLSYERGH
jgi:uncharacterized protein